MIYRSNIITLNRLDGWCSNFLNQLVGILESKSPLIVLLSGELGAGKTTFVASICRALRIFDECSSPSYVLEHQYVTSKLTVRHWDLYRVDELPLDFYDSFATNEIYFVEWGEKFKETISWDYNLTLEWIDEVSRKVTLEANHKSPDLKIVEDL